MYSEERNGDRGLAFTCALAQNSQDSASPDSGNLAFHAGFPPEFQPAPAAAQWGFSRALGWRPCQGPTPVEFGTGTHLSS